MALAKRLPAALFASAAVLALSPGVLGHGNDTAMDMGMGMGMEEETDFDRPMPEDAYPPTYFSHSEYQAAIYTHISIMVVAWVFVLPIGKLRPASTASPFPGVLTLGLAVMLSLARSRYTLAFQFVFVAMNAVGVLVGGIYNANTPDLYPNNAHHKLGWIVTWTVLVQVLIGLLSRFADALRNKSSGPHRYTEQQSFIPVSTQALAEHGRLGESRYPKFSRLSNDSGQGTEPNTDSLRSHSPPTSPSSVSIPLHDTVKEYDQDEDDDLEAHIPSPRSHGRAQALARKLASKLSSRAWKALMLVYSFVDRTILILAFITLSTGVISFGRFFEGQEIFNGLAHWIKGGIFVWLGILTLGRWAGCFGELGWAWNIRPRRRRHRWEKWVPTAEFAESALIFSYGSTNIFLEHLGGWGGAWTAQDFEHTAITVLFIGGGLCGMLVESTSIRNLLNTTVSETVRSSSEHTYSDEEKDELLPPRQYSFSMNPIPALVILLLGIMMSSHTQGSMVSAMVHKQWGDLLTGASFARALTYVTIYLKPPKSILPSRPPTELLTAFGLIAGGIIFMASSSDTVRGMIHYGLDAMFMYTVTMGLVGLLMAWVIFLIALKGWAVRKEAGRSADYYRTA